MAVTGAFWFRNDGYDVHVVQGAKASSRLDVDLVLEIDHGADLVIADKPPRGVTVRFEPGFSDDEDDHGVHVDTATGAVTAEKAPPGCPGLRNFVVRAVIIEDARPPEPEPEPEPEPLPFEPVVRVHIHESIRRIRLTPSILSLRAGVMEDDGFHFAVLADFDDGTTGEVSDWSGLRWSSDDEGKVVVSAKGLTARTPGADVGVSVSLDPSLYPAPLPEPAKARVLTLPSWPDFASKTVKLRYIPGSGPGPQRFGEATNVLFLSEGFKPEEKVEFDDIVNTIVHDLQTMRTVRPISYDLKGSINFWAAFVPSTQSGVSVLSECVTRDELGNVMNGSELDVLRARQPDPKAKIWGLGHLIHEVGLPVRIDDLPPKNLSVKVGHWRHLYGKDSNGDDFTAERMKMLLGPPPGTEDDRYDRWCRLSRRVLVNELDTAFHMTLGGRPRAERERLFHDDQHRKPRRLQFHPRRTNLEHFQQFLSNLKFGGIAVGSTWVSGKDRGLVCFIPRVKWARAAFVESDGYFYVPVDDRQASHRLRATKENGVELVAGALLPSPYRRLNRALTCAHEMGHALGLGDEYGEEDRLSADREDEVAQQIAFSGNLQTERSLRADTGAGLDPDKIRSSLKWLWPRVRAGGVLASKPEPEGTDLVEGNALTISLRRSHGRFFNKDDIVYLRRRPLAESTDSNPTPWLWLRVEEKTGDTVKARIIVVDAILIGGGTNSDVFVGDSDSHDGEQASVLLTAVLSPKEPVFPGTELPNPLPLVAPTIVEHMATSMNALDALLPILGPEKCNPDLQKERAAKSDFAIPNNLPDDLFEKLPRRVSNNLRKKKYFIIGLYQGGQQYYCGVYHPGGVCLMRTHGRHRRGKHRFCHVCRYLLVDRVDPTRHGAIDKVYANEYPEPEP